jgi:hypothetical protein
VNLQEGATLRGDALRARCCTVIEGGGEVRVDEKEVCGKSTTVTCRKGWFRRCSRRIYEEWVTRNLVNARR